MSNKYKFELLTPVDTLAQKFVITSPKTGASWTGVANIEYIIGYKPLFVDMSYTVSLDRPMDVLPVRAWALAKHHIDRRLHEVCEDLTNHFRPIAEAELRELG